MLSSSNTRARPPIEPQAYLADSLRVHWPEYLMEAAGSGWYLFSAYPARTFGPALYASYWHALWIYFIAPPSGMLGAAEFFLLARKRKAAYCAKLHHRNDKSCMFRHSGPAPTAPATQAARDA